jgi:hypothetical protein
MVSLRIRSRLFLLREPILAEEGTFLIFFMASWFLRFDGVGTIVAGTFYCKKSDTSSRELDVEIHHSSRQCWDDGSGRYGGSDIQSAVILCEMGCSTYVDDFRVYRCLGVHRP